MRWGNSLVRDTLGLLLMIPGQVRSIPIETENHHEFKKAERRLQRLAAYYRTKGYTDNYFTTRRLRRGPESRLEYKIRICPRNRNSGATT